MWGTLTTTLMLSLLARRWYVMVLGAMLLVGIAHQATHTARTYYTQCSVILLPPSSTRFPNVIEDPHVNMIPLAGLVVTDYNQGRRDTLMGSAETTLYGEGLREGSRVRLPNNGSQWQAIYDRPNIDVQVVGSDPVQVGATARQISADLTTLLYERQAAVGVQRGLLVTALVSPEDPVVVAVGGSSARAAVGMAVSGAALTTLIAVQLDRFAERRRRRVDSDPRVRGGRRRARSAQSDGGS
jgi:hypothetical protein